MKKLLLIFLLIIPVVVTGCFGSISGKEIIVERNLVKEGEGEEFRKKLINEDGTVNNEFLHNEINNCSKIGITKDYINEIIEDIKKSEDKYMQVIYFADIDGGFDCSLDLELPDTYDPRERIWYKKAMEEGIYISDIYVDYPTGNKLITFSTKIYSKDIKGVLGYDYIVEISDDLN